MALQAFNSFPRVKARGQFSRTLPQCPMGITPLRRVIRANCSTSDEDRAETAPSAHPPVMLSGLSKKVDLKGAVEEAVQAALLTKGRATNLAMQPKIAIVFCSSTFVDEYTSVVEEIRKHAPSVTQVIGCTGYGIVGNGLAGEPEEVEGSPALSITLADFGYQVDAKTRVVTMASLPDGDAPPQAWSELLGVPAFPERNVNFIVLADPSFLRVDELTAGIDFAFPQASVLGGLVSGVSRAVFHWDAAESNGDVIGKDTVRQTGAVVLSLYGDVAMDLHIAQGCRPLSDTTWTIEKVESDSCRILQLRNSDGSGPSMLPLEALVLDMKTILDSKAQLESTLRNMTLGLAPSTLKSGPLEPHDFLIRSIGIDRDGNIVVGDFLRQGQQIRFMVRDKQGAMEDLKAHGLALKRAELAANLAGEALPPAVGMMVFSCNGRGKELYGEDSWDSKTMGSFVGPVPCTGFLCNGEIGKVGGATHLHGFTAAVGVLRMTNSTTPVTRTGSSDQEAAASSELDLGRPPESP